MRPSRPGDDLPDTCKLYIGNLSPVGAGPAACFLPALPLPKAACL